MRGRLLASASVLAVAVASASLAGHAQPLRATPPRWNPPTTPWGTPDLQGIWNYATMTPLERPREVAGKDVLSESEAAAYERQVLERQSVTNNTASLDLLSCCTHQRDARSATLL